MPEQPKLGAKTKDGKPVLGMKFEDSRSKLLKFKSSRQNPTLKESLINQVKLHEGKEAANALRKEVNSVYDQEVIKKVGSVHIKGIDARAGRGSGNNLTISEEERAKWEANRKFSWCPDCNQRCYVSTFIGSIKGNSLYRCGKCGTDCIEITEEELRIKQEEYNGRKNC